MGSKTFWRQILVSKHLLKHQNLPETNEGVIGLQAIQPPHATYYKIPYQKLIDYI